MRNWSVSAFFPEVKPAHIAQLSTTVAATSIRVAAHRGLARILDLEAMKGKHVSIVKLTIIAVGKDKSREVPEGSDR